MEYSGPLETNDTAMKVLGDETLRIIAKKLVESVRKNVTIDWTVREAAGAVRYFIKDGPVEGLVAAIRKAAEKPTMSG